MFTVFKKTTILAGVALAMMASVPVRADDSCKDIESIQYKNFNQWMCSWAKSPEYSSDGSIDPSAVACHLQGTKYRKMYKKKKAKKMGNVFCGDDRKAMGEKWGKSGKKDKNNLNKPYYVMVES